MNLLRRFLCFLNMNHFVRRTPVIIETPYIHWRTILKCHCGLKDYWVTGLVEHPLMEGIK